MTRVLSDLLQAREPHFRIAVKQLEQAAGAPSEDIRLSTELQQDLREKLQHLNLDPRDTTPEELYHALHARVQRDNLTLKRLLNVENAATNVMPRIERLIEPQASQVQVFGIKNACAKRILKLNPPKRIMKQLGYRSLDSLLKHETPCSILAAARLAETLTWQKALHQAYKRLTPADFESRPVVVTAPSHQRWETFAEPYVRQHQHNIVTVAELGAVVMLPFTETSVPAAPFIATLLALQAVQEARITSSYLKLQRVRPDFGTVVAQVVQQEPITEATLLKMPLPWKMIHQFFARNPTAFRAELFEPHVAAADLQHEEAGTMLARLHPTFEFWEGNHHLGMPHLRGAVSMHPIDAALNFINHLPFEQRIAKHMRGALWHELLLRYMRQDNLSAKLRTQLGDELVGQPALV